MFTITTSRPPDPATAAVEYGRLRALAGMWDGATARVLRRVGLRRG